MRKTSLIINNKIGKAPIIAAIIIFVVLSSRVGYLSLSKTIEDVDIQKFAKSRTTKEDPLYASRGTIYDGNVTSESISITLTSDQAAKINSQKKIKVSGSDLTLKTITIR